MNTDLVEQRLGAMPTIGRLKKEIERCWGRIAPLEADNARGGDALKDVVRHFGATLTVFGDRLRAMVGYTTFGELSATLDKAKAALTGSPAGAFVNIPMLMLFRDTIQELLDVQNGCPLPDYQEMFDAANEQAHELLDWLAAKIEEATNADN